MNRSFSLSTTSHTFLCSIQPSSSSSSQGYRLVKLKPASRLSCPLCLPILCRSSQKTRALREQEDQSEKSFSSSRFTPPLPNSFNWDFEDDAAGPLGRASRPGPIIEDEDLTSSNAEYRRYRRKARTNEPDGSSLLSGRRRARTNEPDELSFLSGKNNFILAGIFVLGIGAGIALDSGLNVEPNNVASREVIDRQTPNPDICLANGMSAMVLDHRLFITFNPFNVFVSQAEVKPGCVLRQSNWNVLESRGLISADDVRDCQRNMNTFGFVGDLRQAPEISCVYHSESAENQFLKDPAKAALGDGFQPKDFKE